MSSPHYITLLRLTSAQGQMCCSLEGLLSCCGVLLWSAHVLLSSLLCGTALPLSLAHCPSSTWPHLASARTLAGSPMTVQQEPRHRHNGTSMGSTLWDNASHNACHNACHNASHNTHSSSSKAIRGQAPDISLGNELCSAARFEC